MALTQFSAVTGRKKPSGAVDAINALAPGYLTSLENRAAAALTQKGLDITAAQIAEQAAMNKAQLAQQQKAIDATNANASTATNLALAGLGVQAIPLLPSSITTPIADAAKSAASAAYDILGRPIASALGLGGAPAAQTGVSLASAAAAPAAEVSLGAAAPTAAGEVALGGSQAAPLAGADAISNLGSGLLTTTPTTFTGGLGAATSAILNGTLAGDAGGALAGTPAAAGLAGTLGAVAPFVPIALAGVGLGKLADAIIGSDPTEPWSPKVYSSIASNLAGWNARYDKMGASTPAPTLKVPLTPENYAYYSTPQGGSELRAYQIATMTRGNGLLGTNQNPEADTIQAKTSAPYSNPMIF